jgi:hypothetical protein
VQAVLREKSFVAMSLALLTTGVESAGHSDESSAVVKFRVA